jgi:hypothetical protein
MLKEVYIIKGRPSEEYAGFKKRIMALSHEVLNQHKPGTLKLNLTTKAPPRMSVIPFKKSKIALWSVTGSSTSVADLFTAFEGFVGGYVLEEAIPVAYDKNWADGQATPGECLLTLFHCRPGTDRETFLKRWHEGHTPLSLKLHPLWNYNRNVVTRSLGTDAPWYDGIVEEQFRKASDLLNPLIFFGPPLKVPIHMYQVLTDTRSFIDMKRIETYLTTEIHLKSQGSP